MKEVRQNITIESNDPLYKAVKILQEKYKFALNNEYIKDKKGWALYHTWKEVAR